MEWALDFEPYDDIQHLIGDGTLKPDTPALAVARQVIALGFSTLSNRQRLIYDRIIAPALAGLAREEGQSTFSHAA